ncbi:putative Zinc transporter putativecation transporter [Leptomonas pyrrhocoris]|uniref:Putative Zinc transporter putativecation transporter n=2 Tax=Leptomonas pyrrhocoris TaxID=157538 RepID=A0A0N0VH81_LEPPY|nr:putative Zinc transporter putativecation transporter [Leptomonas pyrrhocoris]XP_015663692.1 putative Zinc transporter putativecation transporter [Leptomonas pyrrhocoris]XP_015663693.1 putative Zinc transporter putativecation transporter [Leptomonas pyrrhocoris]KPA85252.1 putative Zinc transporter putativecation transporter [Leptomonas pyrrhocoris]KPA85253.1 putative Zinc transporter putativecation transporter [Leptomonas pyrrhocoris]KPA85254.1 putative Zinc transporter putativecation transp|eukprot:XP_015663691.1 putative Zinc transporter putativecation transporter [Leptomonas pyrrhocoris]
MSLPTLETCRQLFGDVLRAAVAAQSVKADEPAADTPADAGDDDDGKCSSLEGTYEVGLHIGAIFIILAASLLGTLIPLVGKRVPALRLHPYVYAVGKSTATGVVLAVAMIHMIGEATSDFDQDCVSESFRDMYEGWAFLFAMIAAVLMHAVDGTVAWIAERWSTRAAEHEAGSAAVRAGAANPCDDSLCKECPAREVEARQRGADKQDGVNSDEMDVVMMDSRGAVGDPEPEQCDQGAACHGHQHGVAVPSDMPLVQRAVAAICMEFGVTLHSVFVGLAVAVSNGSDLRALIIALVFHQMFEGLAMGARLADASFKLSLEIVLMLVFSFSAPIGIAAGTGAVVASRDAFSGPSYAIVSAVLDSICGGIMLYIAFNLLFVDFAFDIRTHCSAGRPYAIIKRMGLYAGLWIGAGVMALIGKWL